MGKIKRKRNVLHLSAPKSNENYEDKQLKLKTTGFEFVNQTKLSSSTLFQNVSIPPNLFKDVAISAQALKQKLPTYSAKDVNNLKVKEVVASSQREKLELELRKQNRRKKIPFSDVVSSVLAFLKKKEKEDKTKATAILENYGALKNALPDLNKLMKESQEKPSEEKPRVSKRFSKQDELMMEDIQTYQGVLKDSQYASDPFSVITAQIKQKFQSGTL